MAYWWIVIPIVVVIISSFIVYFTLQFYPTETMEIPTQNSNFQIFALKDGNVNCYAIKTTDHIILFDTGLGKNIPNALKKVNLSPEQVTHIFLTHSDYDHVGGLKFYDQASIYISIQEEQLLKGEKARLFGIMKNKPLNRDYNTIKDGDLITIDEEVKVKSILTPGHTIGHTCYLVNNKYLFTGDTLRLKKERILPFFTFINMNTSKQRASINKLIEMLQNNPIKLIATGHTGYSTNIQRIIQNWL